MGSAEWPNLGFQYDFHPAIDIARTGNVVAMISGKVIRIAGSGENQYMVVQTDEGGGYWDGTYVRYVHFVPRPGLKQDDYVSEGEVIGTVVKGGDHLHLEFNTWDWQDLNYTVNPMAFLSYLDNNTNFTISDPQHEFDQDYGNYISYRVQIPADELDMAMTEIFLTGRDDLIEYDTFQLTRNRESKVDFDLRINCGSDDNFVNGIRIVPRIFYSWSNSKTIYFHFFLYEFYYQILDELKGRAIAQDLYSTEISSNLICKKVKRCL